MSNEYFGPTFIGLSIILCGISVYLCYCQWHYLLREQVCCSCKISRNQVHSTLLAVSSTLIATSTLANIFLAAFLKRYLMEHNSFIPLSSRVYNETIIETSEPVSNYTRTSEPGFLRPTVYVLVTNCMHGCTVYYILCHMAEAESYIPKIGLGSSIE